MPDLNSNVLEVVIALAFVFFLLSTVSSGITEAISWFFQKRAKDLEAGIRSLLTNDAKANELLEHPLIQQLAPSGRWTSRFNRKVSAYLSPRTFALAFLDTIAPPPPDSTGSRNVLEAVRDQVAGLPEPLKKQLLPMLEDAGDEVAKFRQNVEQWFDDAMARVSGWYTRWAQVWICLVAAAVTIGFNVDTLRVADRLWNDDALRESTVGAAINTVNQPQEASSQTGGGSGTGTSPGIDSNQTTSPGEATEQVQTTTDTFHELQLPVGWSEANDSVAFSTVIGWLITFFAVSLGAPFWFDALSKLARLRTTGPRPSEHESSSNSA